MDTSCENRSRCFGCPEHSANGKVRVSFQSAHWLTNLGHGSARQKLTRLAVLIKSRASWRSCCASSYFPFLLHLKSLIFHEPFTARVFGRSAWRRCPKGSFAWLHPRWVEH